jgi:hypothetical protein
MTIDHVSYQGLTEAYSWLIKATDCTMLDAGHPAQPLALAIEAEIVKRHAASVEFMQAKQETGCLVCVEENDECDGLCQWCDNAATAWVFESHYCNECLGANADAITELNDSRGVCLDCGEDRHPGSDYCGYYQCIEADRRGYCPGCGSDIYDTTGLDTPDDWHCSDCYGVTLSAIAFHKFGYEFTPNQVDLAVSLVRDGQFDGVAIEAARAALS